MRASVLDAPGRRLNLDLLRQLPSQGHLPDPLAAGGESILGKECTQDANVECGALTPLLFLSCRRLLKETKSGVKAPHSKMGAGQCFSKTRSMTVRPEGCAHDKALADHNHLVGIRARGDEHGGAWPRGIGA
jgi:hypothetical protein